MVKCIKKAPFEINLQNIRNLSITDGEKLYHKVEEVLTVSEKESG